MNIVEFPTTTIKIQNIVLPWTMYPNLQRFETNHLTITHLLQFKKENDSVMSHAAAFPIFMRKFPQKN